MSFLGRGFSNRGFTLIELMIVVVIIGLLASIAIPSYLKYVKRARTSEALTHVKVAYDALAEWYSNPTMGNGIFLTSMLNTGTGGLTFSNHFPEETHWLTSGGGDLYCTYSFTSAIGRGGGAIPKITATARNMNAVFAMLIQSMDGGGSTVQEVSIAY